MNNEDRILQLLEGLTTDVKALKEDVSGLKEDVSGLKEDVSELKEDVSELKEDVSELKEDVSGLKEDVRSLNLTVENELRPHIQLLAEGQQAILEKLTPQEVLDDHEDRLDAAEAQIRVLTRDVAKLKRAQ